MSIELITGKALSPHVDSADDGAYHARTMGEGAYILHGCACTMTDANTAHVAPGELLVEGRHIRIAGIGEDVVVENGTQGQKRRDLVVMRYELGEEDVEEAVLKVVKGVPTATGEPSDPPCAVGSILAGDPIAEHPLFRVSLDGVSVGEPVSLCEPWEPFAQALSRRDEAYPVPLPESATVPSDLSMFAMPPAEGAGLVKRSAANVWTWIAGKVRATFGFGANNVLGVGSGGTGGATAAAARSNLGVTLANIGAAAASHTHTASSVGAAPASHTHSAANITSGVLPVKNGGTGTTTNAGIGLMAYPVGAVYISFVSTSPASLFGGSWTAITGRFPYFNASTATGGSDIHAHTLSAKGGACIDTELNTTYHLSLFGRTNGTPKFSPATKYSVMGSSHNTLLGEPLNNTAALTGITEAASSMPAYQSLYAWRRTA